MRLKDRQGGILFGSKNQPGDPELYGIHVFRTVHAAVLFSVLACGVAVGFYFLLRPYVGTETVSWMCVLGAATKLTISNRRLNRQDFEKAILIPMQEDGLDLYRKEYNAMLLAKVAEANSMVQEKYVTISACKKSIEEARAYFARVGTDLMSHFMRLGSKCVEMDATDKLRALHDFYRTGEETDFRFDLSETMKKATALRTLSARIPLSLKRTISEWGAGTGECCSYGSTPHLSRPWAAR